MPHRDPLEWFRIGPRRYRFETRTWFWLGLFVGLALFVASGISIVWTATATSGRAFGVLIVLACLLPGARFLPRWRWFEIEDAGATWTIRQRYGWSLSTWELEKTHLAMATVENDGHTELFFPRDHHIEIHVAHDRPFARTPAPIVLGDAFGLPVAVLVEICRLLAPGYARETYLLTQS